MPGRETLLVPGLPLGMGIALGAIISPTDAVATAIVRRAGIPPRIVPGVDDDDFQAGAARETVARFRALRLEEDRPSLSRKRRKPSYGSRRKVS